MILPAPLAAALTLPCLDKRGWKALSLQDRCYLRASQALDRWERTWGARSEGCQEVTGSSEAAAIYRNGCSASISPWGSEKVASDLDLAHGQSGM